MHRLGNEAKITKTSVFLMVILSIFVLLAMSIQNSLVAEPTIVDNLDYSYTATWEFDDMTNYTLSNVTGANGEINLTKTSSYWNQSSAFDFAQGQSYNVIPGDGVIYDADDLVMGILGNQNFTSDTYWEFQNSATDKVASGWQAGEEGWLYCWIPENIPLLMSTLQPDGAVGMDSYINESDAATNYGGDSAIIVGSNTTEQRGLFWFDVSSISNAKIVNAQLELYFYQSENASSANLSIHRVTNPWTEGDVSWQDRILATPWGTPGGDFDAAALDTVTGFVDSYGWKFWNITSLVDGWVNGTITNDGVLLDFVQGDAERKYFYSSDYATASLRPKLNITYFVIESFNETANFSQDFDIQEQIAYIDTNETNFNAGILSNITVTDENGGQIELNAGGTYKYDPLDNVTWWAEDPDTTNGKGSFTNTTAVKIEGTGSMKIDMDLSSTLQNYGVMRTTGTYWNWSIFQNLKFWVNSSGAGEVLRIILEDTFGGSWQSSAIPLTDSWEMKSFDLSTLPVNISRIDAIKFHLSDTLSPVTTYIDNITLSGGLPYDTDGIFTSRVFDGGYVLQWQQISWNATLPANTNIDIRSRTGNTSTPDVSWSGWSAIYPTASGSDITSPIGRYIQYQAYLNTSNILVSPVLSDVSLGKMMYNLTFTYSVDAFANITWARFYVELDGQVIWEDILSGTQSANVVTFDISSYLTTISTYEIRFGLTVNSSSTSVSNITVVLDDIQIRTLFGQHTSNIYDAGTETTWTDINWVVVLPQDTNITLITRTSSDNVSWSSWSSPYAFNKDNITSPTGRYIQYQLVFSRVMLDETPVFRWINISSSFYETQGILTFNNDLTVVNVTNWGTFSAVSILRGQSITYEFSVDSGSNWNAIPADGNLSFVSTSSGKIRFRAIFETTDTSVTPSLCSMNLTYYVNRPPVIVGVVPDQSQGEDGGTWYLDLTSYESDSEDSNLKLRWSITGENTSLYTVSGELSDDDNLTFTPLPNAWGNDQVTLWLEDSYGARTSQVLWINITPQNDAPVIQGSIPNFDKDEDEVNWNYFLSTYKSDVDNSSGELTWQIAGWDAALFDSVSIVGDIISFDLAQDASGNDEMTITLSDGLLTDTQNFWVNVTPMNDAPVISGIIPDQSKNEDDLAWTLDLTLLETDVEDTFPSASLSWSVTGVNSALISVGISDNNITFTPKPDAYGNNEITITLTDSGALTDSQTVWINITPSNDNPTIIGTIPSFDKNEDNSNWNYDLSGFKSDIDNSSGELTWQIAGWDPLFFDFVGIAGDVISFDLALNAFGNDEMTITLTDGLLSDSQNIWVNVTPVNDAPMISGGIPDQIANEDDLPWALDLTSFETDIEDAFPSANLIWGVSGVNGSLFAVTVSDNNLTFSLVPNAFGNNEITVTLTDSGGLTDSQNIWVNVTSENDAPMIFGAIPSYDKVQNDPNWQFDLSIYRYDIDNMSSELSWSVAGWDAAFFDSVSIIGDIIFFDLKLDAVGNDEMTITLSDGLLTDSQNIWVNVTPVNNPPVISGVISDQLKNEDDLPWTLDLTAYETDIEDTFPSFTLTWGVSGVNGSLCSVSITDNNLTFTLIPEAFGNNEITIVLTDSGGLTDSQTIWVNVTSQNDAPIIIAQIPDFTRDEDDPNWNYDISGFKSDIDNLSTELSWQVSGWDPLLFDTVSIAGDTITFDLALNAYGNDEITITLSDGLLTDSRNFWVNVTSQNDAPIISGGIPDQGANEDDLAWTVDLTTLETDIEDIFPSTSLSWSVSGVNASLVSVSVSDNNLTFTLVPDGFGNNEITIILTDSGGLTDSQYIWVNVTSSNDAPSIFGVIPSFEKGQNTPDWQLDLSIYKNDIDNSSSELTWSVVGWDVALFDSVSIVGDIIYFDLALDAQGTDEMTIILSDGLQTDSQNIWVNITSVNNPPMISGAITDQSKNEDEMPWTLDLTTYETDSEDPYPSPILVWTVSGVNGSIFSVLINDNNITFTLMPNAFGNDEITITLMDSGGSTDSQSIWVNITPENDAPQIIAPISDFSRNEDATNWNINLFAFKSDVDNVSSELSWQVSGWDPLLFDSVGIAGDLISFDLAPNAFGSNEITITLSDGLLMHSRTFWMNVTPQNDAPTISGGIPDQSANEDDLAWTLDLTTFETDIEDIFPSSGLSWGVSGLTPNPVKVTISDNNITFTLVPDTYGNEEFVIILTDSGGLTDTQSIWINVSAMNDAPEIFGVIPSFDRDEDASVWTIDLSYYKFDVDNTPAELSWSVSGWSSTLFDSVDIAGNVLTFDLAANAYGDDEITITLGDGLLFSSQNIWVNVTSINDPPSILGTIPNIQKDEDSPQWTLDLMSYGNDLEDGSPSPMLTWSVLNVNFSLINVTITDNILTFDVVPNTSGDNYITIILTDSGSATDSQLILVRINPVNDAPVIQPSVGNVVIAEDTNTTIDLLTHGNDIEDLQSNLRWYINGADSSLYTWQIDPVTNILYIESLQDSYGTDDVTLVLTDTKGAQDTQPLQILILPINDPPYILPAIPQSSFEALEDEAITVMLTGYENDVDDTHDLLTWSVEGVDSAIISVSVNQVNDELVIVPIVEFPINSTASIETDLTLVLMDFGGLEARQKVTVTINPVNNAPLLGELPDLAIKFDKPYVFYLSPYIYDEDTPLDSLTIITSEPTVDGGKGYISISGLNLTLLYPVSRVGDSMVVLVILSDGQLSSYSTFHVDITDNNPPELASPLPDVDFDEDTTLLGVFDLDDYFTDQESVDLNYSFYPQYTTQQTDYIFVSIDLNNSVDFYSAIDWFGDQRITFRAEDSHGAFIEYTITATVNPINDPPVLFDIPDQSCKVGAQQILDLLPFVEDVDTPLTSLTFTIDSTFATVQGSSLVFFYDQPTKETVMVTVNDGQTQDSMIFEVTASNNLPPSIDIIPKLIVRGGEVYLFSLRPYISDPDDEIEDIFVWTDSDFITINTYDNLLLQIDFPTNMTGEEEDVAVFFSDGQDSNLTIMHIRITDENIPKLINILPNIFFHEDTVLHSAINLNDYFENAKNYSFFGNNNLIITIENGAVNLSAVANWFGTEKITFRGTAGEAFAEDTIDIVVRPVNDAPVILPIPNFEKQENEIWALNLLNYIHDIDTPNNLLIVSVEHPHAMLYSFNLYFQSSQETADWIILTVSDSDSSVSTAFWVNVTKDNDPPLFLGKIGTAHIGVGETWSIDLDDYFFDINGDQLTFWSNDPNIVINPLTHEAIWTPVKGDYTLQNVTFFANDGTDTTASSPIDIVIAEQEPEPSVWERFWWVFLLVALIAAGLIAFAILARRREEEEIDYEIDVDKAVKFLSRNGGNYIIKSQNSDSTYKVFSNLLSIGFGALCITTKQTEPLVKQYNLGKAWIIKLTLTKERGLDGRQEETRMVGMLALGDEERRDDKYIFSSNFNSIVNAIEEFLLGGENKMVLMDGVEYILGADEMIKYVSFISSLREKLKMGNSCLLIPVDPKTLSEKELSLLERETVNLGETLHSLGKIKDAQEIVGSRFDSDTARVAASEGAGNDKKGDKGSFW